MSQAATSPVILLAYANDKDDYLPNLRIERTRLYKALQPILARDAIHVEQEWETSIDGLFEKLVLFGSRIAIIHYAGHADGTSLHFETANGAETAHATGLAQRFAQLPALQLVFLNGCATNGQVAALLDAGVKAVIATSVRIDDAMATDFAAQFYTALADETGKATIESAFATARAFIATRDPSRRVETQRGAFNAARASTQDTSLIWGLYARDDAATALAWRLPTNAPLDLKQLQERLIRGSIDPADPELAMFFELYKLKVSAGATPVPAAAVENFTTTVTALATADDPADRRAAASAVAGDDAGAYDQLFALAEAGAATVEAARAAAERERATAEAETAAAAARFRQAGALAAPTSITRAISAYSRAADLDPADFWTWIQLAGLYRRGNSLLESRRCAERARQIAITDRDRGFAESELGDIAAESGDVAEARRRFFASLEIRERLAATNPRNAQSQHDLLVSHERIGDIAIATGDLVEARRRFTASQGLIDNLAMADPDNRQLQRALSIIQNKLGNIATTNGDLIEARRRYTASFEIRERLAAADAHNSDEQRDLSVSHDKLGNIATAGGDLAEARRHFTASLGIRDRLATIDPDNSGWQRDLSISHEKLGNVAFAGGDHPEARRRFTASLDIRERLAAADPHNSQWQRNLAASLIKLGELEEAAGDIASAIDHYRVSLPIIAALAAQSPDIPARQSELAYARQRLIDLGGDPDAV